MYWFLYSHLEEQRNEVWEHLSVNYRFVGADHDPMSTFFSIKNYGKANISAKHHIICYTKFAVGDDGKAVIYNVASAALNNTDDLLIGDLNAPAFWQLYAGYVLTAGGDEETEQACLKKIKFGHNTVCVDVTIIFHLFS